MGIDDVRIFVQWQAIAPANSAVKAPDGFDSGDPDSPGYNWARVDRAVSLVSAAGMRRPEAITSVALRTGFGGLVGFTLALLFGLTGTAAGVAALGAAAPIGFTAVVLSAREGLDLELTASAAAISVFLGSLWIPLAVTFV